MSASVGVEDKDYSKNMVVCPFLISLRSLSSRKCGSFPVLLLCMSPITLRIDDFMEIHLVNGSMSLLFFLGYISSVRRNQSEFIQDVEG